MGVGRSPFVFFYHITYLAPSSFVLLLLFPTLNVLFATRRFRPPATRGFRPPATRGFSGVQTPRPGGHSIPDPFVVLVCFGPAGAVLRSLMLTSGTHNMGVWFLFTPVPRPLMDGPSWRELRFGHCLRMHRGCRYLDMSRTTRISTCMYGLCVAGPSGLG